MRPITKHANPNKGGTLRLVCRKQIAGLLSALVVVFVSLVVVFVVVVFVFVVVVVVFVVVVFVFVVVVFFCLQHNQP